MKLHLPIQVLVLIYATVLLTQCTGNATPQGGDAGSTADQNKALKWYFTCGDPACGRGYVKPKGVTECKTEKAGDPCSTDAQKCDPKDNCNRLLQCSKSDPTKTQFGCPQSRRIYKKNIHYIQQREREALYRQALRIPLTTYHYKKQPKGKKHLGFIIEDLPSKSPAIAPGGQRVNLYGYTSMTLAAVQEQAKQMRALREDMKRLRVQLKRLQKEKNCVSLNPRKHHKKGVR